MLKRKYVEKYISEEEGTSVKQEKKVRSERMKMRVMARKRRKKIEELGRKSMRWL